MRVNQDWGLKPMDLDSTAVARSSSVLDRLESIFMKPETSEEELFNIICKQHEYFVEIEDCLYNMAANVHCRVLGSGEIYNSIFSKMKYLYDESDLIAKHKEVIGKLTLHSIIPSVEPRRKFDKEVLCYFAYIEGWLRCVDEFNKKFPNTFLEK